jgi:hypothetical protein
MHLFPPLLVVAKMARVPWHPSIFSDMNYWQETSTAPRSG